VTEEFKFALRCGIAQILLHFIETGWNLGLKGEKFCCFIFNAVLEKFAIVRFSH
jgi:hypothetical protein